MKHTTPVFAFLCSSVLTLFLSCDDQLKIDHSYYTSEEYKILSEKLNLPVVPEDYELNFPSYLNNVSFINRSINSDKATLGRVLFYDKNLSSDKSISCASCHKQEIAFSDNVAFSVGAHNRLTTRNSLALGSVLNFQLYYGTGTFNSVPFFWDNSAMTVQEQSKNTMANPNEMDMDISKVKYVVNSLPYYKPLATKAFQTSVLNGDQILDAIAEFTNSITNYSTKFDSAVENFSVNNHPTSHFGKDFNLFTAQENRGKALYSSLCSNCHGSLAGQPGKLASNNGLYTNYKDLGAGKNQGEAKFKVPTLRNLIYTAPYMHDGSIATLDGVLEHYSQGIKYNPGLDESLTDYKKNPVKMNLSKQNKEDLIAFLNTLIDDTVMKAEKFSDPFKK